MGPIYVESCDLAQQWLYESLGQEVRNMSSWNSPEPDFAPIFFGDQLLFTSSRQGSKKKLISFNPNTVEVLLDFYTVERYGQEPALSEPSNFELLNTHLHEGPACLSPDSQSLYFTRTIVAKRDKKSKSDVVVNTLQLFRYEKDSLEIGKKKQSMISP